MINGFLNLNDQLGNLNDLIDDLTDLTDLTKNNNIINNYFVTFE